MSEPEEILPRVTELIAILSIPYIVLIGVGPLGLGFLLGVLVTITIRLIDYARKTQYMKNQMAETDGLYTWEDNR